MKKYFLILGLAFGALLFLGSYKIHEIKETKTSSPSSPLMTEVRLKASSPEQVIAEEASKEISSFHDLEKKFEGLSDKEIAFEIARNDESARIQGLFQKANSGGLNPEDSAKMVEHLRTNQILHKIILDRQLDELQRKIL